MPVFFNFGNPGQAVTVAVVSSLNSPYTAQPTDFLIKIDSSNGSLATVNLESTPSIGSYHIVLWWKWSASSPPPVVNGNSKLMTPYAQDTLTSGALVTSTAITQQNAAAAWFFDGTQWLLVV